jgi:hypothetical protein
VLALQNAIALAIYRQFHSSVGNDNADMRLVNIAGAFD